MDQAAQVDHHSDQFLLQAHNTELPLQLQANHMVLPQLVATKILEFQIVAAISIPVH